MSKKPIVIITSVVVLAICCFVFIRGRYLVKPDKKEVIVFLDQFNADLKQGFTDTLLKYFDEKQNTRQLAKLLRVLSNKTSLNGRDTALFDVNLISDDSQIKVLNAELTEARVPVEFKENGANLKQTVLIIKLRKISTGKFKITQIDARKFVNDFVVYENNIKVRNKKPQDIYAPITLQAFKTAEQLKAKYDTVVWFAHIDKKNFFYVVKGKWNAELDIVRLKNVDIEPYKMGLVNDELREIIPPEYDLIHNIGATFDNLVEVEKGTQRGFYDLTGKIVIPVEYDQIYPINDEADIAVLKKGSDYFYLEKDFSISNKVDLKLSDFFSKIRNMGNAYNMMEKALSVITEYNSHENHGAVFIAPSYLVDFNMIAKETDFKNPLRKLEYEEISKSYEVSSPEKQVDQANNWLEASLYSIRDYFLGGRAEFYDKKNIVIVDKRHNLVFAQDIQSDFSNEEGDGTYTGKCAVNSIRALSDSLFEFKSGAAMNVMLYDSTKVIDGGTYYHYFAIQGDKLIELPNKRMFGFTKYIKMDDSYLNGCYELNGKQILSHITPEMLRYMKNEIYADYRYQFKDERWQRIFEEMSIVYSSKGEVAPNNTTVDDSLTVIDKYNINFIDQRLKAQKPQRLAAVK